MMAASGAAPVVAGSENGLSYAGAARALAFECTELPTSLHDVDNALPNRPCTAVITPRVKFQGADIFAALTLAGIDPNTLGCVQRRSSGDVVPTFHTAAQKELFLSRVSLELNNTQVAIQDIDRPLTYLNIYDAPHELPDMAIIRRLAPYCEVVAHRRGRFREPQGVFNGIRHYRVRLLKPIPSYLRFGKSLVVFKHDGQLETCRRCNGRDHFASGCRRVVCFNCDQVGHQSRECPSPTLCSICKSDSHRAKFCPLSWDRSIVRIVETTSDNEVQVEAEQQDQRPPGDPNPFAALQADESPPSSGATAEDQKDEDTALNRPNDDRTDDEDADSDADADADADADKDREDARESDVFLSPIEGRSRSTSPQPNPSKQRETPSIRRNGRRPAALDASNIPTRVPTRPTLPAHKPKEQPRSITPPPSSPPKTQELFPDTQPNPATPLEMDTESQLKRSLDSDSSDHDTQKQQPSASPWRPKHKKKKQPKNKHR